MTITTRLVWILLPFPFQQEISEEITQQMTVLIPGAKSYV